MSSLYATEVILSVESRWPLYHAKFDIIAVTKCNYEEF